MGLAKVQQQMVKQFPAYKKKSQNQTMYDRALNKFSLDNTRMQMKDADIKRKNNLKFIHFHIEAFDEQIAVNMFTPEMKHYMMNPRMLRGESEYRRSKKQDPRHNEQRAKQSFKNIFKQIS
jgi:uncharacterized protein YgiB involved in biofilm formation